MSDLVPTASLGDEVAAYGPTRRVQVLITTWLAAYDSENTQKAYARDLRVWIEFCDNNDLDPLGAIRAHIDVWRQQWAGFKTKPADTSLARRLSAVSSWYDYLVKEDVLDRSPAAHIKRPKIDGLYSPTRGLDKEGARAMLEVAADAGPRDFALICLLLLSGLRCHEALLADVEDLGQERGHKTLDVVRKGGAKQRVPLAAETHAALEAHLADRTSGPLFVTRTGARLSARQAFRDVRELALVAKVPHAEEISPHSLRHTFATLAMDAGAPIRDVQDAMGHRDPKTTIRYDRARGNLDRNPTYGLARFIKGDEEEAS